MDTFQPLDPDVFVKESRAVVDFIANYYRDIEQYPVRSQVEPGYLRKRLPDQAPLFPQPIHTILDDIRDDIFPGLTHWQSPNFYAYFQANTSNAGFLGEMLCSGLNIVTFNWIASPATTELESIVIDWMGKMLKLPSSFLFSGGQGGGGILYGSTSEAVVCALAAARDRALSKMGDDGITKLVVYASDQTHSTVQKASKLIGIPPSNFRVIPTSAASDYALTPDSVRSSMEADVAKGLVPLYLCATIGTTALGAVDPLLELGKVANEYGVWYHIDAAYAGSSGICPEFRHYFDGVELADSFSTTSGSSPPWNAAACGSRAHRHWWTPCAAIPSTSGTRLVIAKMVVDYKDWQIALSRRFRAMKLWVVIWRYGVANLMEHKRSDVAMAKHFERLVAMDQRFELVVPRKFSLVCFRLKPRFEGDDASELNRRLLEAVNSSGQAFMTHAVVAGMLFVRFAIGATLTEMRHVEATWKLIQAQADGILLHGSGDEISSRNGFP